MLMLQLLGKCFENHIIIILRYAIVCHAGLVLVCALMMSTRSSSCCFAALGYVMSPLSNSSLNALFYIIKDSSTW